MSTKRRRRKTHYSGIGGQAVLEGVMMKNKEDYAIACRKEDGTIDVDVKIYHSVVPSETIRKIPFVRGVISFIDSLILGMRAINHSALFYEEEEEETVVDRAADKVTNGKGEKLMLGITTVIALAIAVGLFILLPYFISVKLNEYIRNDSLLAIIEGGVRIVIFLGYIIGISAMKDIRRLYRYHGAEHKCINCVEKGYPLTVENVMRSSRFHRRCGTSFLVFVILISVVLFFFIRVESPLYRVLIRLALVPVIAGISYEFIRLAGKGDNFLVSLISAPGLLLQRVTTKEPDEEMAEVAIRSVEAVFDWKKFLMEEFPEEYGDGIEEDSYGETPGEKTVSGDEKLEELEAIVDTTQEAKENDG
ncbi:MAG: DUF1385 domain-containing protein [Lachnospiraceae bacterium]|nr:DUF1385 domain-containing protein [Lachnospiraceae bacterium]